MKNTIILLSLIIFSSCEEKKYHQGSPIIVKKQDSFIPGKCIYTYEGYGREEIFDDYCDRYQVGDTLK